MFSLRSQKLLLCIIVIMTIMFRNTHAFYSSSTYENWSGTKGNDSYDHVLTMGTGENVAEVRWKISGDAIFLSVVANAIGWVGFGIAESGGMPGGDIVIYNVEEDSLTDAHALAYAAPIADACQNWELVDSAVDDEEGVVIFEAMRQLVTNDPQDHEIKNDADVSTPAHRAIVAWGDGTNWSYHGPKRATSMLRFYQTKEDSKKSPFEGYEYVDLQVVNYLIPLDITTYYDFYFDLVDLFDVDTHIVGFQFIADKDTLPHVHHFAVSGGNEKDMDTDTIYIWAPGTDDFILPENVGFLAGPNGYRHFVMNVHYDNAKAIPGLLDNSGIRLWYTTDLREHEAGIFSQGDANINLVGQSATGKSKTKTGKWDVGCPTECWDEILSSNNLSEITVIQENFHMHEVGTRMTNTHLRDGEKIRERYVDYYDFRMAGMFAVVQEPFTIRKGDSFETSCYFKSPKPGVVDVPFGYGSQEEMCIVFMVYYPKIDNYKACGVDVHDTQTTCSGPYSFSEVDDTGRIFGKEGSTCPTAPSPTPSISPSISSTPTIYVTDGGCADCRGSRLWSLIGNFGFDKN